MGLGTWIMMMASTHCGQGKKVLKVIYTAKEAFGFPSPVWADMLIHFQQPKESSRWCEWFSTLKIFKVSSIVLASGIVSCKLKVPGRKQCDWVNGTEQNPFNYLWALERNLSTKGRVHLPELWRKPEVQGWRTMTGQTQDVAELICSRIWISEGKVTDNIGGLERRQPEQRATSVHRFKSLAGQKCWHLKFLNDWCTFKDQEQESWASVPAHLFPAVS